MDWFCKGYTPEQIHKWVKRVNLVDLKRAQKQIIWKTIWDFYYEYYTIRAAKKEFLVKNISLIHGNSNNMDNHEPSLIK